VATTTLTGTTGNDILNAPGVVTTEVVGLGGADTITLALRNDVASAGSGHDSIFYEGAQANQTVNAGLGNDTLTLRSATVFGGHAAFGEGNDRFVLSAGQLNGGLIQGQQGDDVITFLGGAINSTVGAGQGNDSIAVTAGNLQFSEVFGAKGKDTINLNGGGAHASFSLQGSNGSDLLLVTGGQTFSASFIGMGKGTDSIDFNVAATTTTTTVAGGGLNDTINIRGGLNSGMVVYGDANGTTTVGTGSGGAADGNDSIYATAGYVSAGSVYGGGGNDTIYFQGAHGASALIDGGNGADVLGGTAVALSAGTIAGGAGFDTITLAGTVTASFVLGGDGEDSISVLAAGNGSVDGGAGADKIQLNGLIGIATAQGAAASALYTVNGGAGADSISFGYSAMNGGTSAVNVTTGLTAGTIGNYIYESGDTIAFSTGLNFLSANWEQTNGTIVVATAIATLVSQLQCAGTGNGNIGVIDTGDDLIIGLGVGGVSSSTLFVNVVGGGSLITNSAITTTGVYNAVASNFGFSIAAINGTNGANITFS